MFCFIDLVLGRHRQNQDQSLKVGQKAPDYHLKITLSNSPMEQMLLQMWMKPPEMEGMKEEHLGQGVAAKINVVFCRFSNVMLLLCS